MTFCATGSDGGWRMAKMFASEAEFRAAMAEADLSLVGMDPPPDADDAPSAPAQPQPQPMAPVQPSAPQPSAPEPSPFTAPAAGGEIALGVGLTVDAAPPPTEPEPVVAEAPEARPFPMEALGPLKDVAELVARRTQAPEAIAGASALAVAALAVQGHADVRTMGGGTAPCSLFLLTIAQSGERKSTVDKLLSAPLAEHEREQAKEYGKAMQGHIVAERAHKQKMHGAEALIRKGEAGAEALEAVGPAPLPPLLPERTVSEPTFEGMTKLFAEGNPSLGLLSDEGGQFLGGFAMNSENKQKTLTAFSKLWDGDAIKRTRAGDGTTTLFGRRMSLHLMIQPIVAEGLLSDPLAIQQGFLPRCLVCQPPSNIGSRWVDIDGTAEEMSDADATTFLRYRVRLLDILRAKMPSADERGQELEPRTLELSPAARRALGEFAVKVEMAQAPGGALAGITGAASKAAEQACRIAGVLTMLANLDAREIPLDMMERGISLAGYYLTEALRLTNGAVISKEMREVEELRKWLLERWPAIAANKGVDPEYILPSDVARAGPAPVRQPGRAKEALLELARLGWLVKLPPGTVVNGRVPRLAFRTVQPADHAE